jgi:drug/metabolite transporter (DMT)-like permease
VQVKIAHFFVSGIGLTIIAMIAFAGNALLSRAAFQYTAIDAASFTLIRLVSGAILLAILVKPHKIISFANGNWYSAIALFIYATAFSYAFVELTTATGAVLGFGAVQLSMLGFAFLQGERFNNIQLLGIGISIIGVLALLLPSFENPPLIPAILMLLAGTSWSIYTLLGNGSQKPTLDTSVNFARAALIAMIFYILFASENQIDIPGFLFASLSGSVSSGLGYIIWYMALPYLTATTAASVQLSVPVLASFGGVLFFDEMLSLGMILISTAILSGIMLVIKSK